MPNGTTKRPFHKSRRVKTVLRLLLVASLLFLIVGSIQYSEIFENAKEHVTQIVLLVLAVGTFLGLVVNNQLKRGFTSFGKFLEDETAQIAIVALFVLSLLFYFSPRIFQQRVAAVKFLVYAAGTSEQPRVYVPGLVFVTSSTRSVGDSARTGRDAPGLLLPEYSILKVSRFVEDGADLFNENIPGDFAVGSADTVLELPVTEKLHTVTISPNTAYRSVAIWKTAVDHPRTVSNWKPGEGGSIVLTGGSYMLAAKRTAGTRSDTLHFEVPQDLEITIPPPPSEPQHLVHKTVHIIPPESNVDIAGVVIRFTNQRTQRILDAANGQRKGFETGDYSIAVIRGETLAASHGPYRCRTRKGLITVDRQSQEIRIELVYDEKL